MTTNRKLRLPFRKRSVYEEVDAIMSFKESQKHREGYETEAEANDFYVPDEADDIERYFTRKTPYEFQGELSYAQQIGAVKEFEHYLDVNVPPLAGQQGQEAAQGSVDRMPAQLAVDESEAM